MCRFDFLYLCFMNFNCAHRNLPCLALSAWLCGVLTVFTSTAIFFIWQRKDKWHASRHFVIPITDFEFSVKLK